MKRLFLVWGPFGTRADELAESVGAVRRSITMLYGPRYFALLRYPVLFFRTLAILFSERPDLVYAQNPPTFCPLACMLYCKATGTRLIIDHHCVWSIKTLHGPVGKAIGLLEGFVSREAYANTTPHRVWAKELTKMGAKRVRVVHDLAAMNPFPRDESTRAKYGKSGLIAIASHGGHPLERVEAEVQAAAAIPALTLLVTGPPAKLASRFKAMALPANVRYLGMLPLDEYVRLKASCDFGLNITDEPYTLSHVIFEWIASGIPVISSRQEVVEEVFGDSVVYVSDSRPEEIAAKIWELISSKNIDKIKRRASERYAEIESEHEEEVSDLRMLVSAAESQ